MHDEIKIKSALDWKAVEEISYELIDHQKKALLEMARRIVPYVTQEDILQPNDFADLEQNPSFRYEEGVLCGLETLLCALRALKMEM